MSELKEDLDRALRTVTFSEAPVERAKRAGHRIRTRRRFALLAGVLAVAAVAAGYPALARNSAAPPAPLTGTKTQAPHHAPYGGDQIVTEGSPGETTQAPGGLTSKSGQIAVGAIGDMKWQMSVVPPGPKSPVPTDSCYTIAISVGSSAIQGSCNDIPSALGSGLGTGKPAAFTELSKDGTTETTVGETTQDVAYFLIDFTDGQQLKLIPVTVGGHRYIAWMAPLSMTIQYVVAHLGGPYNDSGQIGVAVPFEQPGQPPVFGRWQPANTATPPPATKVIGHGTTGGHAWKVTAYAGPWGTCFVTDPIGSQCVPADLGQTAILGWGTVSPVERGFGSAAPGVASVRVSLSNGKTVTAAPVIVGNEDLFAFPTGQGVSPTAWTAYNASGQRVGAGSVTPASA
jgi:hypothetical protein